MQSSIGIIDELIIELSMLDDIIEESIDDIGGHDELIMELSIIELSIMLDDELCARLGSAAAASAPAASSAAATII